MTIPTTKLFSLLDTKTSKASSLKTSRSLPGHGFQLLFKQLLTWVLLFLTATAFCQTAPTTNGLVLHWAFEETSGSQINDSSPSGYGATFSGSVSRSASGKIGSCLQGANGGAWTALNTDLTWTPASGFSVSFWIYPTTLTNYNQTLGSNSGWGGFIFQADAWNGLYVGTSQATRITLSEGLSFGKWQHFTFTYEAGTGRLYKNGVLVASKAMATPSAWAGFRLSGNTAASSIHGNIDEVRIYNRAITASEAFDLSSYPAGIVNCSWKAAPVSSDWNDPANWTSASVPVSSSEVFINACTTCPVLSGPVTVQGLTINGGGLTIGTNNVQAASVRLVNASLHVSGATLTMKILENMQNSTVNGNSIFAIGNGQQLQPGLGKGGNTFDGDVEFRVNTPAYSSSFLFGNGTVQDTYKGNAKFRNLGNGPCRLFDQNTSVIEKDLLISNENLTNSTGGMYTGYAGGNIICKGNATIITNSTNQISFNIRYATFTGTVTVAGARPTGFGSQGSCTFQSDMILSTAGAAIENCTFGPNATLRTSITGVDLTNAIAAQLVTVKNTTFQNPVQSIDIWFKSSNHIGCSVMIGPAVVFTGKVTMKSHYFELNGAEYKEDAVIEKTGKNPNYGYGWNGYGNCSGGNTFRKSLTLTNSSGYDWKMATVTADRYEGNLILTYGGANLWNDCNGSCGSGTLQVAASTANTYFGGTITVSSLPGAKGGIILGAATLPWQLLSGKQLLAGSFPAGSLTLNGFQQQDTGDFPLSLTSTAILVFGKNNLFQGSVLASAPGIYLNGSTFLKPSTFTKTGAGDNVSVGGNSFKSKLLIINQATSGSVQMATQSNDIIDKATVINP